MTPAPETAVFVAGGAFRPPLVQREGGIGDHDVEAHQAVALHQRRVVQRVAPLDARGVAAVQIHIHTAERPGAAVALLPGQEVVAVRHLARRADEQRAGPACRVADAVAALRRHQPRQKLRNHLRRVKFASFLAGARRELLDQEFIRVADDILALQVGRPQIELIEILQQVLQPPVAVARLPQVRFAVEVDAAEDVLQLDAVLLLDGVQRDIDRLADIVVIPVRVQVLEGRLFRNDEPLARHRPLHPRRVAAVARRVLLALVPRQVGQVLHEEHGEDVILVLRGVDGPAERIAGSPQDAVDLVLGRRFRAGHHISISSSGQHALRQRVNQSGPLFE